VCSVVAGIAVVSELNVCRAPVVEVHVVVSTAAPELRLRGAVRLFLLAGAAVTHADEDAAGVIPALDILQLISLAGVTFR
jgi:hypothetical protein